MREGDRPLLRGAVPLTFRTPERLLVMTLPGEPVRVFRIRLPAGPKPSAVLADGSRWIMSRTPAASLAAPTSPPTMRSGTG